MCRPAATRRRGPTGSSLREPSDRQNLHGPLPVKERPAFLEFLAIDEKQTRGVYGEECGGAHHGGRDDAPTTRLVEREMRHGKNGLHLARPLVVAHDLDEPLLE